jgi:hypothetical protein
MGKPPQPVRTARSGVNLPSIGKAAGVTTANDDSDATATPTRAEEAAWQRVSSRLNEIDAAMGRDAHGKKIMPTGGPGMPDGSLNHIAGTWVDLSKTLKLQWDTKRSVIDFSANVMDAQNLKTVHYDKTQTADELAAASSGRSPGIAMALWPLVQDVMNELGSGVTKGIFLEAAMDSTVDATFSTMIASIPVLAIVVPALAAANDGRLAYANSGERQKLAKISTEKAVRPGTPEAALAGLRAGCDFEARLIKASLAVNATKMISGILAPLSAVQAVVAALVKLAIKLATYAKYFWERRSYGKMVAGNPYGALSASPTMSAYVLMTYPAILICSPDTASLHGVTDSHRMARHSDGMVKRAIWNSSIGRYRPLHMKDPTRIPSAIEQRLETLRSNALRIYDGSRLIVEDTSLSWSETAIGGGRAAATTLGMKTFLPPLK